MRSSLRLLALALLPAMLALAGCSYSPARITPEPLIVVDGGHRHYHGDGYGDKHRYRHRERYVEHRYYYDDDDYDRRHKRHRGRDRHHHRGAFCPPGLGMQGRC